MVNSDELPGKAVKPASRAPRKDVSLGLVSKTFGIMFLMEFTMFYVIVLHVVNDISAQNLHVPHSVSNASFQSLEIACKTIHRLSMLQNYDEGPWVLSLTLVVYKRLGGVAFRTTYGKQNVKTSVEITKEFI